MNILLTFNMHSCLGVVMVGRGNSAISVSLTQAVLMGVATSHGNANVKPTGEACSATKVLNFSL